MRWSSTRAGAPALPRDPPDVPHRPEHRSTAPHALSAPRDWTPSLPGPERNAAWQHAAEQPRHPHNHMDIRSTKAVIADRADERLPARLQRNRILGKPEIEAVEIDGLIGVFAEHRTREPAVFLASMDFTRPTRPDAASRWPTFDFAEPTSSGVGRRVASASPIAAASTGSPTLVPVAVGFHEREGARIEADLPVQRRDEILWPRSTAEKCRSCGRPSSRPCPSRHCEHARPSRERLRGGATGRRPPPPTAT